MYMYENEKLMLFWRETLLFSMRGPRAQLARKKDSRSRLHCVCATLLNFFLAPVPAPLGI